MCDDLTAHDADAALAARGLTRRDFAALSGAAALIGCTGASEPPLPPLGERSVSSPTSDGVADAFLVHPPQGAHPGILLWPDIAGLREAYRAMARRLAAAGYAVLVVNQYYRNAPAPVMASFAEWLDPAGQARLRPMIAALRVQNGAVRKLAGEHPLEHARVHWALKPQLGHAQLAHLGRHVPERLPRGEEELVALRGAGKG